MNRIRVYLQSPWKFSDSPYYLYLRQNPPLNVEYVNANELRLNSKSSKRMKLQNNG